MAYYKIYAGLGGSFGGAYYRGTFNFENENKASMSAYEFAIEEYQSYEGLYGLTTWEDCRNSLIEEHGVDNPDDELVDEYYTEEISHWLNYYTVPAGPDDID